MTIQIETEALSRTLNKAASVILAAMPSNATKDEAVRDALDDLLRISLVLKTAPEKVLTVRTDVGDTHMK